MEEACKSGNIELVKKLEIHKKKSNAVQIAAENGHLELVKYLLTKKAYINSKAIRDAAKNGHLELVKFLKESNAPINSDAIMWAAINGHLNIVKFLKESNAPIDSSTTIHAFKNNIVIFKYLVDSGAPTEGVIEKCAEYGYLDIVKYLVSMNICITENTVTMAVKNLSNKFSRGEYVEDTELLTYLINNNAPINKTAVSQIRLCDYFYDCKPCLYCVKMIKYLLWNGAPYESSLDIEKFKFQISKKIEPIVLEFIGPDITSIIIEYLDLCVENYIKIEETIIDIFNYEIARLIIRYMCLKKD